jgi:hypothetical protein
LLNEQCNAPLSTNDVKYIPIGVLEPSNLHVAGYVDYWASFFISASFLSIIALNEEKGCAPFSISGLEPSLLFTITKYSYLDLNNFKKQCLRSLLPWKSR